MIVNRDISNYLVQLSKKYPVVTITGPRQSGKTTLAKTIFPDKKYINLELMDNREFALNDPRGFLKRIPEGAILDEIQRAPELVSYIQGIVDQENRPNMFILTGSQQFELSNSINQSLAGRTALLKLLPFSINEIFRNYTIASYDELIYKSCYPRIYSDDLDPTQALGDYFETYVERDLRQLVKIKNLSLFQKFVKMCAGRVGQLLNLQSIGNDVGISHTTAREWITLLESSYIIFLLEPYYENIGKRLIKSPKIYFYDVGLACYLLGVENISHVQLHPLKGHLFENLVILELLKYRFNQGKRNNLNFYRDSSGNEVDIIYNIAQYKLPIEIKAGETVNNDFFKGLNAFEKIFPELPYGKIVFYAGDRIETRINTRVLPVKSLTGELIDLLDNSNRL